MALGKHYVSWRYTMNYCNTPRLKGMHTVAALESTTILGIPDHQTLHLLLL